MPTTGHFDEAILNQAEAVAVIEVLRHATADRITTIQLVCSEDGTRAIQIFAGDLAACIKLQAKIERN